MTLRHILLGVAATAISAASSTAAELSVWALQADMRAVAGDPDTHLNPSSLTFNPASGELLICCGGGNGSILEWPKGATTGTLLVPRANWSPVDSPSPFACAYIPSRGTYLVAAGGGDDAILEVTPGVSGQTPTVSDLAGGRTRV